MQEQVTSVHRQAIRRFEARVNRIVGHRIVSVHYREIDCATGEPCWPNKDFDSIHYGVEIGTAAGELFSVIWHSKTDMGLMWIEGSLDSELRGIHAIWDVTRDSRWRDVIGREVVWARVFWSHGEDENDRYFPAASDIALMFEGSSVIHLA